MGSKNLITNKKGLSCRKKITRKIERHERDLPFVYLSSYNDYHLVITTNLQELPALNNCHPLTIICVLQLLSFTNLKEEPKHL